MSTDRIELLVDRYFAESLTDAEQDELTQLAKDPASKASVGSCLRERCQLAQALKRNAAVMQESQPSAAKPAIPFPTRLLAAAAVLLAVTAGALTSVNRFEAPSETSITEAHSPSHTLEPSHPERQVAINFYDANGSLVQQEFRNGNRVVVINMR